MFSWEEHQKEILLHLVPVLSWVLREERGKTTLILFKFWRKSSVFICLYRRFSSVNIISTTWTFVNLIFFYWLYNHIFKTINKLTTSKLNSTIEIIKHDMEITNFSKMSEIFSVNISLSPNKLLRMEFQFNCFVKMP